MKPNFVIFCLVFTAFIISSAKAADFINSIGMEFNTIPSGSFYMGSCKPTSADGKDSNKSQPTDLTKNEVTCPSGADSESEAIFRDDEIPQHLVQISKPFQIGVYEVTLGQFRQFIDNAGRDDLLTDDFIQYNNQGNNAPVVQVSWDEAQAFIRWLNQKEGGECYRLPAEAQWEYAARGGTTGSYSFQGPVDDYAWYNAEHQHPVGQKLPNPYGLYDMHGNVAELTQDYYDRNYYSNSPTIDPEGPKSGKWHVLRGGAWGEAPGYTGNLRSAHRMEDWTVGDRSEYIGFRLCRQIETSEIILSFVFLILAIGVYIFPMVIAKTRRHHNKNAIAILNLFLGWTLIGWVASLVWASTSIIKDEKKLSMQQASTDDNRKCPYCAEITNGKQ